MDKWETREISVSDTCSYAGNLGEFMNRLESTGWVFKQAILVREKILLIGRRFTTDSGDGGDDE